MNDKKTAALFLGAAGLSYISAAINFFVSDRSVGVLFLCLGSALLCFGSVFYNRSRSKNNNNKN